MRPGLGWNPVAEEQHADALAAMERPVCKVSAGEIPDAVNLRGKLPINGQSYSGTCSGQSVDKASEGDYLIEHGEAVNFSPAFSYLMGREQDGVSRNAGWDVGVSISGVAVGASEGGLAFEPELPFWKSGDDFSIAIPDSVRQAAKARRIRSVAPLGSAEQVRDFIGSGQGFPVFGMWWLTGYDAYDGSAPMVRSPGGSNRGGHALAVMGYCHIDGELFLDIWNSHTEQWGDGGRMYMHWQLFDQNLRTSPFGARGLSGLPTFTKRPFKGFQGINS